MIGGEQSVLSENICNKSVGTVCRGMARHASAAILRPI